MHALLPPRLLAVCILKITTFKKLPMIRPRRKASTRKIKAMC
jgi:hypothetical protein